MTDKHFNYRKFISIIVMVVLTLFYMVATDPDVGLIANLSFGIELIYTLKVILVFFIAIALTEVVPDIFVKDYMKDEKTVRDTAIRSSEGAGQLAIARSIRFLGYCIVISVCIVTFAM